MWGGVPFTIPSTIASKYINDRVKVEKQSDLRVGGRYNARMTMDREMRGYKQSRQDMLDSYVNFEKENGRTRSEPPQEPSASYSVSKMFRTSKPGSGLGMTEPRMEKFMDQVDVRKKIPGYIGGIRLRDSCVGQARNLL